MRFIKLILIVAVLMCFGVKAEQFPSNSLKFGDGTTSDKYFIFNDTKLNIPSHQVKLNDVIKVNPLKDKKDIIKQGLDNLSKKKDLPDWLFFDKENNAIKIVGQPDLNKDKKIDMKLIVEFYSR